MNEDETIRVKKCKVLALYEFAIDRDCGRIVGYQINKILGMVGLNLDYEPLFALNLTS